MKNYIVINGHKTELTAEQVEQIKASFPEKRTRLGDKVPGSTAMIGSHEMIVLDHVGDGTLLLRKDFLKKMAFGKNNNYDGSDVDELCNEFADEIAEIIGEENILIHEVDLTADDGLKDYGIVQRKVSLRTAQMQREYVAVLDQYKPADWEWLATAYSTPTHESPSWVKCVAPPGVIDYGHCINGVNDVRPFCILKSNIFVSA